MNDIVDDVALFDCDDPDGLIVGRIEDERYEVR